MIPAATESTLPPLAVTGATGAIGGQVARILADAGVGQRLLVRRVANAPHLPGATAVSCSYGDRAAATKALSGVDLLFMVSASESGINVYHATVQGSFREVADRLFPTLRQRGLISTDKSGTLRHKLLGRGDRLPDTHPAAAYRGAFNDNNLLNDIVEPVSAAG